MLRFAPFRLAALTGLAFTASLPAQTPPPAQPPAATQTSSPLPATPTTTPEQPSVPLTPAQRPPKRAQVTYADGTLSVSADNSSLNQILRQIATDTGMKITGGVTDERVFGQYGPDNPAQVLAELLNGTGSNMILVHRDGPAPAELILTPRQGGPTPPNPNATAFNDRPAAEDTPNQAIRPPQFTPPPPASPAIAPVTPGVPAQASPPNSSQPDSPNGVKTPQQIYEQLQRLRQQQQQPNPQQ